MSLRWGISKSTVSRYLNKFQEKGYLSIINFTGRNGSIIYLCSYLSTMFNISDIMIDKEEVSMTFKIPVNITAENDPDTHIINENQIDLSTIPECSSVLFITVRLYPCSGGTETTVPEERYRQSGTGYRKLSVT